MVANIMNHKEWFFEMMSFMEKFIPIKFVVSLKTMILTLREKVSKLESMLGIQIIF